MPLVRKPTAGVTDHGALTGLTDDDHVAYATNAEFDDHSARHEDGGADEISLTGLSGSPAALDAHLSDSSDAHDASAVSIVDAGTLYAATDVEAALAEAAGAIGTVAGAVSAHLADTGDAHDASAISILDAANDFTATDVEGALAELQSDHEADATALSDHIADSSAAHAASAISVADSGNNFTGTDVEAVLAELQDNIDGVSGGGAPDNLDYLVGTASGGLSAEIVVGTSPGGELGGSWASPTVDSTHAGSPHSDYIAKAFFAAKGDLIGASANDTPSLLTVGSNGQKLKADSAETTGLKWVDDVAVIPFIIDGGGSVITTGVKGFIEVPFGCTITAVRLLADVSGAIVVDIWKDTYANYPPVDADSITASAPPTISASGTKSEDSTLTGWTTAIAAGNILGFNVDSVTSITRVTVSLTVKKT